MSDKKTETWWIVDRYRDDIKPVEVTKSTEKTVTLVGGRKQYKDSTFDKYFPSWKEALNYKLGVVNSNIDYHRNNLEAAQTAKVKLLLLDDPTVSAQS